MKRRDVIAMIAGAATAWPLAARAQPSAKLPTIGFLSGTTPSGQRQWTAAFVQRLGELGWNDGRNVAIEYRWAEGQSERYAEFAAEFVRLKVDVIVAPGAAAVAAKQATSTIPIVFTAAGDPIGSGLVASLSRPGGNVTGLSVQQTDTAAKRLAILREIFPGLHRLAIMANVSYSAAALEMREVQAAAGTLGLEIAAVDIHQAADIAPAFAALTGHADALYVVIDPLISTNQRSIGALALGARLPTMQVFREYVESGGLISYGPNVPDLYVRAAELVDKILRGTKPADLPVEQPTKFELVINLKTAKALGLSIPQSLLSIADAVIE